MKTRLLLIGSLLLVSGTAQASLFDRGNGLIYDDQLNVTWLQDANYARTSGYDSDGKMTWSDAMVWADQLNFGGFDDWRLPIAGPVSGSTYNFNWRYDGSSDRGYNITSTNNEMAHMFYSLGNLGYYDVSGNPLSSGWGVVTNSGPFDNLEYYAYWSGTEYELDPTYALALSTGDGNQFTDPKNASSFYAWAVRSGDITDVGPVVPSAVPIPGALLLMSSGILMGLVRARRR